ncbi:hypothetical protein BKA70DRAFT_1419631 [Coprinopsis sp. MPI-PUGE-AT-0042]|nr:hypothetical protein BKA70DRAFT_1419631 [Coprinopsis sp. MPI-PUGE-AT-0042]
MTPPLLLRLPLELWEHIINYLAVFDIRLSSSMESLKGFSPAASSYVLLERCQTHLFAEVSIFTAPQAHRLGQVLENKKKLAKKISSITIRPNGPLLEDNTSRNRHTKDGEEKIQWQPRKNPLEHPSLLGLLSKIPSVREVALSGDPENSERYKDDWYKESLREWIKFLSLLSIKKLTFREISVLIELLGRTPNLKRLELNVIKFSLYAGRAGAHCGHVWEARASGRSYLNQSMKSTTLRSLELDAHREQWDEDHWAWLGTLSVFAEFGSKTLTNLIISFPYGHYEAYLDDSFSNHWHDHPKEIGGYLAQLQCLELVELKFVMHRANKLQFAGIEEEASKALEPYLPVLLEGVIRGRKGATSPFKQLSISMDPQYYFTFLHHWGVGQGGFDEFRQVAGQRLIDAAVDPHFRMAFNLFDHEETLFEPLRKQMPMLRKANAVTIV